MQNSSIDKLDLKSKVKSIFLKGVNILLRTFVLAAIIFLHSESMHVTVSREFKRMNGTDDDSAFLVVVGVSQQKSKNSYLENTLTLLGFPRKLDHSHLLSNISYCLKIDKRVFFALSILFVIVVTELCIGGPVNSRFIFI